MNVVTKIAQAVFGPPSTPDTVPGQVSIAACVLHGLLKAYRRWWPTAPLVCNAIAARKAVRQAWDVVGLERGLEVLPLARPGGSRVQPSWTIVASYRNSTQRASNPPLSVAD